MTMSSTAFQATSIEMAPMESKGHWTRFMSLLKNLIMAPAMLIGWWMHESVNQDLVFIIPSSTPSCTYRSSQPYLTP